MNPVTNLNELLHGILVEYGKANFPGNRLWIKRVRKLMQSRTEPELRNANAKVNSMLTKAQRQEIVTRLADAAEAGRCLPGQEHLQQAIVAKLRHQVAVH